jgi:hypothetical protein
MPKDSSTIENILDLSFISLTFNILALKNVKKIRTNLPLCLTSQKMKVPEIKYFEEVFCLDKANI